MYLLNPTGFYKALKAKGYASISEFAKSIGMHRNTIHYYLSGHSVLPTKLDKIFTALNMDLKDVLIKKEKSSTFYFWEPVVYVVDELVRFYPQGAFVLFGSRAKERAHPYSDWDIGVFSHDGLSLNDLRNLLCKKSELEENFPYFIQLVNLGTADFLFLKEIAKHWIFLGGNSQSWLYLQKKAQHEQ